MAQQNRSKEIWLIPKRVNLHQTICLIDGIIERNYDGTSWNPNKQNNLGVNLKKWGATRDGKNISPQAIRTLMASIPQYLGFAYINSNTTPNTICLTETGYDLWKYHKDNLVKIPNLNDGKDKIITSSELVLKQMEKLQITNPVILKDCENILVFPFRMTLKLLLKLDYLDVEELAYFVFKIRDESEFKLVTREIQNFRKLQEEERISIIDEFKKTHIGNITLVQAASSKYYQSLCCLTGIIDDVRIKPSNLSNTLSSIKIKDEFKDYVNDIITKYQDIQPYDFKNNLSLWIEYIGNPRRMIPPFDVEFKNDNEDSIFITIKKEDIPLDCDVLEKGSCMYVPMFINEEYDIEISNIDDGQLLYKEKILPNYDNNSYSIKTYAKENHLKQESLEDLFDEVMVHSKANNFDGKMANYLKVINKITGVNKLEDKSLRGAYYENLFYKILNNLKDSNKIDDVIWNGKISKYGLPVQAPGGKTGTSDIIFSINDVDYVLELTTIKSKAMQFSAECSSVPDHIRLYAQTTKNKVVGIFVAPIIHERNTNTMKSVLEKSNIEILCIEDKKFLELLKSDNIQESIKEKISN